MLRSAFITTIFLLFASVSSFAQKPEGPNDVLMVLPFENKSGKAEFNWIGESFSSSITELLVNKGVGIISNAERKITQQDLKVPLTSIPSLATSLWIAQRAKASLLMVGSYDIPPADEKDVTTVYVKAKVIRVRDGKILSEEFTSSKPGFELHDALSKLQTIQGDLAYQVFARVRKVLYKEEALFLKRDDLLSAANKVPSKAFEAYVKGLLTSNVSARENYLKNALRFYAEDKNHPNETYTSAALELGHLYRSQDKRDEAAESFRNVINAFATCRDTALNQRVVPQCKGEENAEASYYLGWIYFQKKNYEQALAVLLDVKDLKLVSINNLIGVVGIQAARSDKAGSPKAADFLLKSLDALKRAEDTVPDDRKIAFNYSLALFLNQKYDEAGQHFRNVTAADPNDGEAAFLAAKSFEMTPGREQDAAASDDWAKRLLKDQNRYAKLQQAWAQSKSIESIESRITPASRDDFVEVVFISKRAPVKPALDPTADLLSQARALFKQGKYDDAIEKLRRVLISEPMNAESYLMLGKIYQSRGEIDQAISQFKTAIFWDNRLVDAPVALGKIYSEKGSCDLAKTYAVLAQELDPTNQEVMGLQRIVEKCSK
ncbi:MAG: tetratricopeptide repeat protein [Chloracidobacterium sp.]|nr:tetratricopeptide repeat protein [Chloracidobacterium sp.]